MTEKLGEFLKEVRTKRGYTLKEAKSKTKISEAYLWQLENGRREVPRPDTLRKLADGYDVPEETLLSYAGYDLGTGGESRLADADKNGILKQYEKLTDEGKKEFEMMLGYLVQKQAKKSAS